MEGAITVNPGETLSLVGGPVAIVGGRLDASGDPGSGNAPGTIEIRGSVVVFDDAEVLAVNHGAGPGGRFSLAASESITVQND